MIRGASKAALDIGVWVLLTPLAFFLRVEGQWLEYLPAIVFLIAVGLPLKAGVVALLGWYRRAWRRTGLRDIIALGGGVAFVTVMLSALAFFAGGQVTVPRSVLAIEGMLALIVLGGMRVALRVSSEHYRQNKVALTKSVRRVLIVGAGEAGTLVAREIQRHPESARVPVGFLDDDSSKRRERLVGLKVLGKLDDLPQVVTAQRVDEVLIAMPSQGPEVVRHVLELAQKARVDHRIVPGLHDVFSGNVSIGEIREVDLEDLLRRPAVKLDALGIAEYLRGRIILVTGAGGSIGSEIVRQVAAFDPERIILLGRGENSIHQILGETAQAFPRLRTEAVIADVRDYDTLRQIFDCSRPEVVFHAAAHKHVPLMEANPEQAIFNNVAGTRNLVNLALEFGIRRFVNISTDKAVNPSSVMGASKRVAEMLVHAAAKKCSSDRTYVSVRFGNVLGSRGSVIPIFREQIKTGGPVTVTHPDMRRYFMTIPEATQLVLQAGSMGLNGAVCVLDMGEPVRIVDLAKDLILLCGKEPGVDVEIEFTGVRPGEKLFEELLQAEEGTIPSAHEKIFMARSVGSKDDVDTAVERLLDAAASHDPGQIKRTLQHLIPTAAFAPVPDAQGNDVGRQDRKFQSA